MVYLIVDKKNENDFEKINYYKKSQQLHVNIYLCKIQQFSLKEIKIKKN